MQTMLTCFWITYYFYKFVFIVQLIIFFNLRTLFGYLWWGWNASYFFHCSQWTHFFHIAEGFLEPNNSLYECKVSKHPRVLASTWQGITRLSYFSPSSGCIFTSILSFNLHTFDYWWDWIPFHMLIGHLVFSPEVLFLVFCPFFYLRLCHL